eukprot:14615727-Heterocapsa_arctica.AAC.1
MLWPPTVGPRPGKKCTQGRARGRPVGPRQATRRGRAGATAAARITISAMRSMAMAALASSARTS